MKSHLVYISLSLLIFGCGNVIKQNGNKRWCDTIFYKNGIVKSITEIKGDLRDGWRYEYDSTGVLMRKGHYDLGAVNGDVIDYFKNGGISIKGKWVNNKLFGSVEKFYSNGILRQYSCYDFQEKCKYREDYDTLGNLLSREGSLMCQLLSENSFDSMIVGAPQTFNVCVATPPHSVCKYCVVLFGPDGQIMEYDEVPITNNVIKKSRLFLHAGNYRQLAFATVYDSAYNYIRSDTLTTVFNIKK